MISLPASKFSFRPRRALLISAQQAAVCHWEGNDPGHYAVFDAGEEGRQSFRRYLAETADLPFYVLVDVFDEEYRQDTIPHISGRDRRALLKRKAGRLFKDTSYCFYKVTGRETGGRRNDRVLLTALANPVVIKQWVAILEEAKAPLAGISSLPLFTGQLLKPIAGRCDGRRLLVSLQSISGLRQTFFDNGEFQHSRLVQLPRGGPASYFPFIRDEVEKIQRYLNSRRPLTSEEPLHIHFLLAGALLQELKSVCTHQESVRYHFCDLNELLAKSGSHKMASTPFSDLYFMRQLLKARPGNCYAGASERRYFSLLWLRSSVTIAGIVLLAGSVGWSGLNFLGGVTYKRQSDAAKKKAQIYAAQYELARQRLPETPVEPSDLKTAVRIADSLARFKSSPIGMVSVLSAGLNRFPSIQLSKLAWAAANNPGTALNSAPDQADIRVALDVSGAGADGTVYHVALLEGRIDPFNGNFREAMDTINRLAEELRARETVHDVSIVSLPLDVSSGADLQGNTQSHQRRAEFTLRVVLESRRES